MSENEKKTAGRVTLVGAGPGDPGLITRRGLARLRHAEVVIYDALADPRLLAEAGAESLAGMDAERIDVGKRANRHKRTQDQINDLLATKAREGKRVVRLKGGDPYLFGRGGEEMAYLGKHGIPCEMIPGVTAGAAGLATAGIALTHRDYASTVTFITGHEDPTKPDSAVDYQALADLAQRGGTLGFYMGVGRLSVITKTLIDAGLPDETPAAVVQWGTLPRQRSVRGTLRDIADRAAEAGVGAPAIVGIGRVAGLDEPGLDFFTKRPLFGRRIVITRTRQQSSDLRDRLEELGAEVIEAPTIALTPPDSWGPIDQALHELDRYDWLVLTSVNGVGALANRLAAMGRDSRALAPVKIGAIGDATAAALRDRLAIGADLVPTRFVAESLAGDLIAQEDVTGRRFLLLRADIARPALPHRLREAGAEVTELTAYHTQLAETLPDEVLQALRERMVDWITFTSSSTAQNMAAMLGEDAGLLNGINIASIGPITSEAVRAQNWSVTAEANISNIPGLVEAIIQGEQRV